MIWKLQVKNLPKVTCPRCGKKSLVRYVNEEGCVAPMQYGCCDRKNHCGYNVRPGNIISNEKIPPLPPVSYTPKELVNKEYKKNNLYTYLRKRFGAQQVNRVMQEYEVGSSNHWPNSTIFWFKDSYQRYRGGMIIQYGIDGKRVRIPFNHNTYVHKAMKMKDYNYNMCLFGEHLVPGSSKTIGIVEAPKTALIASIVWPEYLWIATNGLTTLQPYFLTPLEGRDIVLFPDKQPDEFNDNTIRIKDYWEKKIPDISKICKSVNIFNSLFDEKEGTDIADLIN